MAMCPIVSSSKSSIPGPGTIKRTTPRSSRRFSEIRGLRATWEIPLPTSSIAVHGGERIINSRGEGAHRNVGQLLKLIANILRRCSLAAQQEGFDYLIFLLRWKRCRTPDRRDPSTCDQIIARLGSQFHDNIVPSGNRQQGLQIDCLKIPTMVDLY